MHEAFPEDFFTHALAMKSNSMRGVLKTVMAHDFMGAEGASIAEVVHAVTCGFKPSHVVYDSPVKSKVTSIEIEAFNDANPHDTPQPK